MLGKETVVRVKYLHHVLKHIGLCVSVAVSLRFADDAVVLEEENMAVVPPRGCSYSWSPFPHLERPLVIDKRKKKENTHQSLSK